VDLRKTTIMPVVIKFCNAFDLPPMVLKIWLYHKITLAYFNFKRDENIGGLLHPIALASSIW